MTRAPFAFLEEKMRCECCTRKLGSREIAHGIRFGTFDPETSLFIPSRESAYTVICQNCGEMILEQVYTKLRPSLKAVNY